MTKFITCIMLLFFWVAANDVYPIWSSVAFAEDTSNLDSVKVACQVKASEAMKTPKAKALIEIENLTSDDKIDMYNTIYARCIVHTFSGTASLPEGVKMAIIAHRVCSQKVNRLLQAERGGNDKDSTENGFVQSFNKAFAQGFKNSAIPS